MSVKYSVESTTFHSEMYSECMKWQKMEIVTCVNVLSYTSHHWLEAVWLTEEMQSHPEQAQKVSWLCWSLLHGNLPSHSHTVRLVVINKTLGYMLKRRVSELPLVLNSCCLVVCVPYVTYTLCRWASSAPPPASSSDSRSRSSVRPSSPRPAAPGRPS